MKTLVVLSALIAVAIAAPALPENNSGFKRPTHQRTISTIRREKKSPPETLEKNVSPPVSELEAAHEANPRSFGLKKPILVKKHPGYHPYRESENEQVHADQTEQCMKEVKVPCNSKSNDKSLSSSSEAVQQHMSDGDVEKSIKIAREAVEHLQRDLHNLEHNPTTKMSQWKQGDTEDSEMHEDIEVAMEALEHIRKNFGNMESMHLRTTANKDTETLKETHFQIASTEEQRMAQWKEAMENIQKNAEIARNIEESFKSASHHIASSDTSHLSKKMETKEHNVDVHEMSKKHTDESSSMIAKEVEQKHTQDKMMTSASELKESKMEINTQVNSEKKSTDVNVEHFKQGKSSEFGSPNLNTPLFGSQNILEMKTSENTESTHDSKTIAHKSNSESTHITGHTEHRSGNDWENKQLAKSAEHISATKEERKIESHSNTEQAKTVNIDTTSLMKSADQKIQQKWANNVNVDLDKKAHVELTMKSADQMAHQSQLNSMTSHLKPIQTMAHHHSGMADTMKAAENNNMQLQQRDLNIEVNANHRKEGHIELATKSVEDVEFQNNGEQDEVFMMKAAGQMSHHNQINNMGSHSKHTQIQAHNHQDTGKAIKTMEHTNAQKNDWGAVKIGHIKGANNQFTTKSTLTSGLKNNEETSRNMAQQSKQMNSMTHHLKSNGIQQTQNHHRQDTVKSMKAAEQTEVHQQEWAKNTEHLATEMKEHNSLLKKDDQSHKVNGISSELKHKKTQAPEQHEIAKTLNAAEHINLHQQEGSSNLNQVKKALESDKTSSLNVHEFQHEHNPHEQKSEFVDVPHVGHISSSNLPTQQFPRKDMITIGKSAEVDSVMQMSEQLNMKTTGKSALEHNMLQWKGNQGSGKSAYGLAPYGLGSGALGYGAGGAGGAGAVGVFPNAKVGGCAIPLLLSCSPSVVSGSLAKSHSSYGAPAYRVGEDKLKLHNKRNILSNNEIPATKLNRMSQRVQKTPYILEKNL